MYRCAWIPWKERNLQPSANVWRHILLKTQWTKRHCSLRFNVAPQIYNYRHQTTCLRQHDSCIGLQKPSRTIVQYTIYTYKWRASKDLTEKRGEFGSRCRTSKSLVLVTSLDRSSLLISDASAFDDAANSYKNMYLLCFCDGRYHHCPPPP